jgi:hypothetical protein
MTTDDEELVRRSLHRLAQYAPPDGGSLDQTSRPARTRRWVLVPILASAAVLVLVGAASSLMPWRDGSRHVASETSSAPSAPSSASHPSPGVAMRLAKTDGWLRQRIANCAAWTPTDDNVVVEIDVLDEACVAKASLTGTTVLVAPADQDAPYGGTWLERTQPWRTVMGHELRRLSSGPLLEMNARVVDAIACLDCDEVVLVIGADPSLVRQLVDSATF